MTEYFYIIVIPIIVLIVSIMVYQIMFNDPNNKSLFGGKKKIFR